MTEQDLRSGGNQGQHSRSSKRRRSARRVARAPLFFESLEPRNLLANDWLANAVPFDLDSPGSVASPTSRDQGGFSTQDDSAGSRHMVMPADMHGNMPVDTHGMDDHHDCCRPQPAVFVKNDAPALTGTVLPDTGAVGPHEATGDHHDCCRPQPAVSVKSDAPALNGTAVPDTGAVGLSEATGDHHDCCRPLPATSGTHEVPTMMAETAPALSSAISSELVASSGSEASGDGEAPLDRPEYSLARPSNPAPVFGWPPVVAQPWDSQTDLGWSRWSVPMGPATLQDSHRTRWTNATSASSISPRATPAVDGRAADKAYAAAVDRLMLDPSDLSLRQTTNTAEGEGELVPGFALLDLNPASPTYQRTVSPRDYLGSVSVWFFGYST